MLMVRSKDHGAVVFGPKGIRYLDEDRVEGEDPTTLFGPHTIMSLKREDAMVHAPDLLLLSQYDPELGEVAAFEELIGSHGGLGGPQTEPFILHPIEWELDEEVPLGAPAIYRNIRRWLGSIGIELGKQPAAGRNGHAGRHPRGAGAGRRVAVARIRYEADGAVSADRFIAALTDFSERRPDLWPGLDAKWYQLHELGDTWADVTEGTDVLGGVWARERYDWSEPGVVRLTLQSAVDFRPGTVTTYRVTPRPDGGCHVAVDFWRTAASLRGRFVGVVVTLTGRRRFGGELREALDRLGRLPA